MADNYESVTHKGFKPYRSANGQEPLPNTTKQVGSGFVREKPLTVPIVDNVSAVKDVCMLFVDFISVCKRFCACKCNYKFFPYYLSINSLIDLERVVLTLYMLYTH